MSNIPRMGQLPTPVSWTICNYLHYGYGSISHVKMSDLSVPFHQHLWKEDNTLDWKLLSPEPPCSYGFQPADPSIFWQLTCPSILKVVDYIILSYYISMIASWHPPSDSSDPRSISSIIIILSPYVLRKTTLWASGIPFPSPPYRPGLPPPGWEERQLHGGAGHPASRPQRESSHRKERPAHHAARGQRGARPGDGDGMSWGCQ